MSIGKRIKERRRELGLSVDELANKLNKNRATIYRYESDEIENLSITVIEPLAKALNTTPSYLMGWDEYSNKNANKELITKVLGPLNKHSGGGRIYFKDIPNMLIKYPDLKKQIESSILEINMQHLFSLLESEKNKDIEINLSQPSDFEANFTLKQPDDSMTGAGINKGDILYVCLSQFTSLPNTTMYKPTDILLIAVDNALMVRRCYSKSLPEVLTIIVLAENATYDPIIINENDLSNPRCCVIGTVVAVLKEIKSQSSDDEQKI